MTFKKIALTGLRLLTFVWMTTLVAQAQNAEFPKKPVKIIVSFSPGSAPDIVARNLAEHLAKKWGQGVLVENKLGADGVIANDTVAKAAPDGYTLFLATMGNLALTPATFGKLPYDPATSFRGVTFIAENPFAILLGKNISANSVSELVNLSKAKVNGLSYGSAGTLGPLVGNLVKKRTGADMTYIPYKGAQPAIVDLLGGQIDMVIADLPSLLPYQQQGKGRVLVVTSESRSSLAREVPTMAESGFKDIDISTWYAVVAPGSTPSPLIDKINADVTQVLKLPEFSKALLTLGMTPQSSTPRFVDDLINRDMERWARVVRENK